MSDIFPFFGDSIPIETKNISARTNTYKDIAWDYKNNCPIIEEGEFKIVEGAEALKSWCYKALQTQKYRYNMYTSTYGNELESLIGQQYNEVIVKAEAQRFVEECLLINSNIYGIDEIESTFRDGQLQIKCKLNTAYDDVELEVRI